MLRWGKGGAFCLILMACIHGFSDFRKGPDPWVAGCVNAITGDFVLSETDLIVQGYVPLRLSRSYVSGDGTGKEAGWALSCHLTAIYDVGVEGAYYHTITVRDEQGSSFTYRALADHLKRKTEPVSFRFVGEEVLGKTKAVTQFRNAKVVLDLAADACVLIFPNGTVREYQVHKRHRKSYKKVLQGKRKNKSDLRFLLKSETLPTGSKIVYQFDDLDRLTRISSTNPSGSKTYASIDFHYLHGQESKHPDVDLFTSDGQTLRYRYEEKGQEGFALTRVEHAEDLAEVFYYHSHQSHSGPLLARREMVPSSYQDVDYYRLGHNRLRETDIKINSWTDERFLRVKTLSAPVGNQGELIPTHRFFYHPEKRRTDVRERDDTLTRYTYTPEMRLESLQEFTPENQLRRSEHFSWSPRGELLSWSCYDASNHPVCTQTFDYDARGNVVQETLEGNLSGRAERETYGVSRRFSEDGRDLLLREVEQNGKVTWYRYFPQTAVLEAQFVCDRDQIQRRTFYEYNGDGVLVKEIVDDGNSWDKMDLASVSMRKIKVITPRQEPPYLDMPDCIEEKMWEKGEEKLLSKTVFSYTRRGNIASKEIYDAEGVFRYRIDFEYDEKGRLISETDPIGEKDETACRYNVRDQVIWKKHPDGAEEKFTYFPDGSPQSYTDPEGNTTTYTYDCLGRKTSETDPLGGLTIYLYDAFHLIATIDAEKHRTNYAYDGAGRKILEEREGEKTEFFYDSLGRLSCVKRGELLSYTDYDLLDRKLREYQEDADGNLLTEICYAYDLAGNLTRVERKMNGKLASEHFDYDAQNRLIRTIDPFGKVTEFTHDEQEFGTEKRSRTVTTDCNGQKTIEIQDGCTRVVSKEVYDPNGDLLVSEESVYDSKGNRISQITFDPRLHKQTQIFWEYDARDRVICCRENGGERITQYRYTLNGLPRELIKPDGTVLSYEYDPAGRLVSFKSSDGSIDYTYRYNKLSQLVYAYDGVAQTATTRLLDHRGRVIQEQLANRLTLKSGYDARGRRTVLMLPDVSTIRYERDPLFLKKISRYDAASCLLYSHEYKETAFDQSGCQLNRDSLFLEPIEGVLDYHYDPLDRLIGWETPTRRAKFVYDPLHRRIQSKEEAWIDGDWVEQDTFFFLYDGAREIGIVDGKHQIVRLEVHGEDMRSPVAIEINGSWDLTAAEDETLQQNESHDSAAGARLYWDEGPYIQAWLRPNRIVAQ